MLEAVLWLAAAIAAVPVVTLLHELGHYLAAVVMGFPSVSIHYESISFAQVQAFLNLMAKGDRQAAARLYPLWQAAVVEIAGPVASIATTLVASRYAWRSRVLVVLGVAATYRIIAPFTFVLVNVLRSLKGRSMVQHLGMDEFDFWLLTGVPVGLVLALEIVLALIGVRWIWKQLPRGWRAVPFAAMLAGILIGVPLYLRIGPRLLP